MIAQKVHEQFYQILNGEDRLKLTTLFLLHMAAYLAVAALFPPQQFGWILPVAALLIWISIEDFLSTEIPDMASGLLFAIGALWLWVSHPMSLIDHLVGSVAWPILTGFVALCYLRFRGWDGFGMGDVKLLAGIGLWAGFQRTILIVLASSLAGILTLLVSSVLRRQPLSEIGTSAVAFGPFLCLSFWVVMLIEGLL